MGGGSEGQDSHPDLVTHLPLFQIRERNETPASVEIYYKPHSGSDQKKTRSSILQFSEVPGGISHPGIPPCSASMPWVSAAPE